MKKIISVLLSIVMIASCIFAFAGCSKSENAKYDVVLITDGDTITDRGFNQSAWNGIKSYCDDNELNCRYYQPSLNEDGEIDIETIENYFELAVNDGAKYVILPGEKFAVSCYEIAPRYADVNFVLIDAFPHSQDDDSVRLQSNVECITFNALQAGYLAGYSAVADGFTKLGYLGSVASKNSGNYGAGFVQGAAFAADEAGVPVQLDYADYDSAILKYDYSFNIKAVYQKIEETKEKTFKVNVVDGIGSGVYTDGENVSITVNPAPEGKTFDHWEVKSDTEGVKDKKVNISSKKDTTINLLVGDCDCTITAVWADAETCPITITEADGKTVHEIVNAPKNSSAKIIAPVPEPGMVFDHWDCSVVEDVNSSETNVDVADTGFKAIPVYVKSEHPTFNVTVENGTGTGSYVVGDMINVVADPPEDGYMFYKWENIDKQGLASGISMENEYCYTTSFEMIDRYSSIVESMYDKGTQVVFGGGNPLSDSIFTATNNFDFPVYAFGSGVDQGYKGNCHASVVTDYGEAIKQVLGEFKGGSIFSGDCSNNCIYVTGKSILSTYVDGDGNDVEDENYNEGYANVYDKLADKTIQPVSVQSGADVRLSYASKCLSLNYWIIEE